jgi:hypothetical protein
MRRRLKLTTSGAGRRRSRLSAGIGPHRPAEAEIAFKKASGMEALEERFEETRFDYLDPFRASVV